MRSTRKQRVLSLLLCMALLFSQIGTTALAEGAQENTGGLCEHHPAHTAECGYAEALEGHGCTHEHRSDCYKLVEKCVHQHTAECYPEDDAVSDNAATPSDAKQKEPTECTHVCSEETGCITKVLDCPHEHDGDCGYIEAVEGHPCGYVCTICNPDDGISGDTPPVDSQPECKCEVKCTADSIDKDCPVCQEDYENCKAKKEPVIEGGTVMEFSRLDQKIQAQEVEAGTALEELVLPDSLEVSVYAENEADGSDSVTVRQLAVLNWNSVPDYTGEPGTYVFTPEMADDYPLQDGVKAPDIAVTVKELPANGLKRKIFQWAWDGDNAENPVDNEETGNWEMSLPTVNLENQLSFDTVVSMLPDKIAATMEQTATGSDAEKKTELTLTGWICEAFKQDENGDWPVQGEYTFAAALPEGYALATDAKPLEIKVMLGGSNTLATSTGDFTVTGGTSGTDYSYASNTLTIKSGTAITISGTTTSDHIVVDSSCTGANAANITLDGVDIQFSDGAWDSPGTCAFEVAGNAACNLTLADSSTNTLKSGSYCAGLQVQSLDSSTATITIDGTGSLNAEGGYYGAGIGGNSANNTGRAGGNITIIGGTIKASGLSGQNTSQGAGIGGGGGGGNAGGAGGRISIGGSANVTAIGGSYAAGIGGGGHAVGGSITINGGNVDAIGGNLAAGIGGGYEGAGGAITIDGGTVTAACNNSGGAGIGGGRDGAGGQIVISGGNVTANIKGNSYTGAGIGGGSNGAGGSITISGGDVAVNTAGAYCGGAGIGGGGSGGTRGGTGGSITISGGSVTVNTTGQSGAGIGGGGGSQGYGSGGSGGNIIISGGNVIVNATHELAAAIGGGINGGASGTFSTGESGNAFIVASSISDNGDDKKRNWKGVIFEGDSGEIYGSPITLTTDAEIPAGKTLEIGRGETLVVGNGVTLTNNGAIINTLGLIQNNGTLTNNGTIKNNGSISGTGTINGSGTLQSSSSVTVTFSKSSATYGENITITATAAKKKKNTLLRSAEVNKVDFLLGGVKLGTANVSSNTATLTMTESVWKTTGANWAIGTNTITADFGGTTGNSGLLENTGTATLTVSKADQTKPGAPTLNGAATDTTVTLNSVSGQNYLYTTDTTKPNTSAGSWQTADSGTLTFSGLKPNTAYYFWTYLPGTAYYNASEVSDSSVPITTDKSDDQKAVETAKAAIEGGSYTVEQATANTQDTLKTALASQINALAGMGDTGITVTTSNISISSFTAATAGDADDPDGTGGSFSFTVSLSKGSGDTAGSATTSSKSGTITATAFTGQTNAQTVAAAKTAIEDGTYTIEQATANTQDAVKTALASQISAFSGVSGTGITVVAGNISISSFTAATAGTAGDRDGTSGSFSFTVSLTKGSATATTSGKSGTITATRYKAPVITTESLPSGNVGTSYTATLAATGDTPITWSVESGGNLPDGLTLSGATISGTPTKAGSFTFTVKASNGNDPDATKEFTIAITAQSADATLKSLTVNGAAITPAFAPETTSYTATVSNGVTSVTISAEPNDGKANMTGDTGAKSLIVGENKFTVTVTAENGDHKDYSITIQREAAPYTPPSGGNGGHDSSGDHNNGGTTSVTPPSPPKPNALTTGTIAPTGKPDKNGVVSISGEQVTNAVNEAVKAAEKNGQAKNGVAIAVNLPAGTTSATLDRAALDRLIASGVKNFKLDFNGVALTFDLPALKEIAVKTTGTLTFGAARATGLTGEALAVIDTRPAYNLTVSYTGADGKAAYLKSFGTGRVSVAMAYTPAAKELTGSLYAVYVNGGKVEWIDKSSYDRNSKAMIFQTGHFSTFGVGYQAPPAFTDTVNHWAKADIDFAASRGLLSGTSKTTFAPNGPMTRGMFVTALGRLAGINPDSYKTSRFTDVPADTDYSPYVEWAVGKGIVNGTGEMLFSPDAAITREQMAAMMQRYAQKLGYSLPVTREAENFTDAGQITGSMKDAVQRVQQAGIMNGKGGHRFGPKDAATRAEAAAVLRRFVEIVIYPANAGGWTQNDSGQWLYYQNGKPAVGWSQIGGKWYYFYADGSMAVNTKIDGYETSADGARVEIRHGSD